jgi:hypothetical protein
LCQPQWSLDFAHQVIHEQIHWFVSLKSFFRCIRSYFVGGMMLVSRDESGFRDHACTDCRSICV